MAERVKIEEKVGGSGLRPEPRGTGRPIKARLHPYVAAACAVVLVLAAPTVGTDPDMLQDVCVAEPLFIFVKLPALINGFPCKANVTADDFFFAGLRNPGNTNNPAGSTVTAANVESFPGVNTLGVSIASIDFAPGGQNTPHTHPRATEIIFVLEGTLEVGFITTANKLFSKTVTKGDVFVFPRAHVHFQQNPGYGPATIISAFNSQLQGTQAIAMTLFGATPPVSTDILAKAFKIGNAKVDAIKGRFFTPK
ncbi:germin-like protein 1-1 [Panicum miliaceum]|uniref:Germin-like protein n=1 Tax=Panicum miliaceum TaxID=4540 RepID=A0A3L6ST37_PANMI|nr:germin-like protein 1-1 [Panicum miliaceum]